MKKRLLAVLMLALLSVMVFFGCVSKADDPDRGGKISIGAMNGPTMLGLGKLVNDKNPDYTIEKATSPDLITAGLKNKGYDAACLPVNNAAIIFNGGEIDIKVAAINTLNVLYVAQKAGTKKIERLSDLSGKTVYMAGRGSTPEYVVRYLLEQNEIPNVALSFEDQAVTIAAGLKKADSKYEYAVLPQPAATTAELVPANETGSVPAVISLSLTDEWKKLNPDSDVVTGVLVVRTAYLKNNKAAFDKFLEDYRASAEFMSDPKSLDTAAQYAVDMQVIPQKPIALRAIPKCGICYIDKAGMKDILKEFYQNISAGGVDVIGGRLPADTFYYE